VRYTISAGGRVIYGQRIQGSVRLTDAPAIGQGRSCLIEENLQCDGNDAMNALIADYIEQAGQLHAIPLLSSVVRRDLTSGALVALALRLIAGIVLRLSGPVLAIDGRVRQHSSRAALTAVRRIALAQRAFGSSRCCRFGFMVVRWLKVWFCPGGRDEGR
jgi:hypothetical protein